MAKPNVISKDELITAAKECLVDKGIEKFTLRAVADAGGVSQGTIYYHFRTKEQVLLEIVKDICDRSWNEISQNDEDIIKNALESAKSRCTKDSFFHKLFFTLIVAGFNNEKIRDQLGNILMTENKALSEQLTRIWVQTPIKGASFETWGILMNALVDGIALQALLIEDFSVEKVYEELELIIRALTNLTVQGDEK